MRTATIVLGVLIAAHGFAAEAWFLPYEPDEDTLVLLHFDEPGADQPNLGSAPVGGILLNDAQVGAGVFGGAVVLDGINQIVRVPAHESLRMAVDQPFTVELWLRPDGASGGIFSLAINYYLAGNFARGSATFGYRAESFPIRSSALSGIPWRRGQWQHLALTHDAERTVRLYLDGELVAQTAHADEGTYTASGGATTFGAHDGWKDFLAGAIDEVRVSRGVREFRPLTARRVYLPGESVRLNLEEVALPATVASIGARIVNAAGEEVLARELPVAEASAPLLEADRLGEGQSELTLSFRGADGAQIASLKRFVNFGGAQLAALQRRAQAIEDALRGADGALPETPLAAGLVAAARGALERRDLAGADGYLSAAERRAAMIASGEATYRHAIRRFVRGRDDGDVRVTMSWDADVTAADAFPWAERIGANELVSPRVSVTRDGLQAWRDAGYRTAVLSSAPIHTLDREHPDQAQFGYWYMDTEPAAGETVALKLQPTGWAGVSVSDLFPPAEHWLVLDLATDEALPPERWSYDARAQTVTITGAAPGQVFRVYYMLATGGIGDPLHEPFAEHGLAALRAEIEPLAGVLDTFWFDDLAYAWPGGNPQGGSDWESYTFAARSENRRAFTAETGIAFDPRWLVMPPRTLDVAPRPEYLAWMRWVQERVKPWLRRATDVVHAAGARTWLYWGDCHVGIEPFLGSLEAGNVDEVDKPAGDPVTARALVDFPGEIYRRLRVDWLYPHVAASVEGARLLDTRWRQSRRGLLMAPPRGLYWMPMPVATANPDAAARAEVVEGIAQISDEFRLMAGQLAGARAYEGGLNLYVVHSWGAQYSWRPWGDRLLWHLTDLPVRVRFISFRDVIEGGVPADAHCLLLYGQPGSAWSGGYVWEDDRLAEAIRGFVHGGGGLVGLQGPSALADRWALSDVFGVAPTGAAEAGGPAAAYSGDEWIDEAALAQAREAGGAALALASPVAGLEQPPTVTGMTATVGAAPIADDVIVAYALVGGEGPAPGMTVRSVGEGRAAWITGCSAEYGFGRLLRSAIFWAARREAEAARLDVTGGEGLFAWAWPERRVVGLASEGAAPVQATLRCDPAILGAPANARVTDVVTGESLGAAAQLAEGLSVTAVPGCLRLLRVE